jgi:mannose-6-phosphate isomerase
MTELYPFLMKPLFDPRPWGSTDLSPIYASQFQEKIGESWLTGDECRVGNGPLRGRTLGQLAAEYGRLLVGDSPREASRFPLLAKFLFPHEKLSVQVHPDDADARQLGHPCGKNECWYVAHARPGAQIGLGLKPGTTREQFERLIHENRAEELLNWITVSAGDMIYVAGGTVHTLGPGAIIVETQQQSDTTFRLYDYGRPRALHLQDGLRVMKEKVPSGRVRPQAPAETGTPGNRKQKLLLTNYFGVEKFELGAAQEFAPGSEMRRSAEVLVAIAGCGWLEGPGSETVLFQEGDGVVLPASISCYRIRPQPQIEFLRSYVPAEGMAEPETFLE